MVNEEHLGSPSFIYKNIRIRRMPMSIATESKERPKGISHYFRFTENNTNLKTEIIAGLTTFATMVYIVAVVPGMLAGGGVPKNAALSVTILMTAITTIVMGLYTNRPFVLGPGLGSVAIFSFTLLKDGIPLSIAAGIVFLSGAVFILISFLGIRDFVVKIIPSSVKIAIGAGIGLFIANLGFRQAGIVVANANKNVLNFGDLTSSTVWLAVIGFFLIILFESKKVKGGMIFAIILTTLLGIPMGITKLPHSFVAIPGSIRPMAFKLDILKAINIRYLPFFFAFFIPDFFSTLGTLLGVSAEAGYLDKNGNLPGIEKCFYVDSCATSFGALFSCPVMTTYMESSAGVGAGGRTGLTAIVAAGAFLATFFFSPLFLMIPSAATAPALMYIGTSMLKSTAKIDYSDFNEFFPALLCIVLTLFSFNSGNGIAAAIIVYAFLKLISGKFKEVHWSLYLIALLMIYYFYIVATT